MQTPAVLVLQEKEGLAQELDSLIEQCEASSGERDAARRAQADAEVRRRLRAALPDCCCVDVCPQNLHSQQQT